MDDFPHMDIGGIRDFLFNNRRFIAIILVGLILVGLGVLYFRVGGLPTSTKVEVLEGTTEDLGNSEIVVEISGSVEKPGVYKMAPGSRIDDLIIVSGGLSLNADRDYIDKYLNRAAKLTDGQKVFINSQTGIESANNSGIYQSASSKNESDSNAFININTASLEKLDTLPGIGPKYGQNIIEQRPYSNTEELVSKGAIGKSLYEKIKDMVSVY